MHPYDRRSHHNYNLNGLLRFPNATPSYSSLLTLLLTKTAVKGQFLQTQSVW